METRPKHIYKPARDSNFYICLFGGLAALTGSYFLITHNIAKAYPQLPEIACGVLLLLFGLYCLYYCFSRKTVYLFEDSIQLKRGLFGGSTEIRIADIQSWAEIHKTSKYNNWEELYIFTADQKYRFESYNYDDYYQLKYKIIENKTRNLEYEQKRDRKSVRNFSFFFLFFGLLFLGMGLNFYLRIDAPFPSKPYVTLNQIITSEIKTKREGRSSRSFELKFNDYPEFNFNIKGNYFRAMYTADFMGEVQLGDTITVKILKDDFEKKLAKTKPLTFWDKSIDYYDIEVVSVSHRDKDYLTLADAVAEKNSGNESNAWGLSIFGAVLLGAGLFIYFKRKQIAKA